MPLLSLSSTVVRSPEHMATILGNQKVILGLSSEEYYALNSVGARIWDMIEEPKAVQEIRDALVQGYDVEPARCERDLLALLQQMVEEGLVEVDPTATSQAPVGGR